MARSPNLPSPDRTSQQGNRLVQNYDHLPNEPTNLLSDDCGHAYLMTHPSGFSQFLAVSIKPRLASRTRSFVRPDNVGELAGPQSLMVLHIEHDYYTIASH